MDIDSVISELGGPTAVAEVLGLSPQAIWNMKSRGTIPYRHWHKLVAQAQEKGKSDITLEALAALPDKARAS